MKRQLLGLLLLCLASITHAQPQALVDSLLRVTAQPVHDTIRATVYAHLVYHHRYQKEKALTFGQTGLAIAQKAKFTRGSYNIYNQLGVVYDLSGDYALAVQNYMAALERAELMQRPDLIGAVNTNLGLSEWNMGNFERALTHYFKALEQFKKTDRSLNYIANTYNNIGLLYYDKRDLPKAEEFNNKALAILDSLPDSYELAAAYTNKGNIYSNRDEHDAAIAAYQESYRIHERIGNDYGMGVALYNIARIYDDEGKYGLALEYALRSLDARTRIGDRTGNAGTYVLLSGLYLELGRVQDGLSALDTAEKMAQSLQSKLLFARLYKNKANFYAKLNQHSKALDNYKIFKVYDDSLKLEQTDKQVRELEVRFDVAQKDETIAKNKLAILDQKIKLQQQTYLAAGLSVLLLLLVILGLMWRSRYQYKQKELLAQERLRERQARIEAVISAQEAEKTRFAADLHDGMGQLLTALRISLGGEQPEKSQSLVEDLYRELRHLAYNIMPQTLVRKGLSDALRELCERIDQTDKAPRVHFNTFGLEQRLPQTHEQLLYRVVQELMTNILKYADASEISLNLVAADGELNIMLEDDGRGFNPMRLTQSKGHGWANVQSRLDMLRAEIDVDSRPDRKGSTFSITLATA